MTKFDLNNCYESDFELAHFYSHKHSNAVFVNNLVLSLINEKEIRSLRNNEYFKIYENYQEKFTFNCFDEFKSILSSDFNISFSDEELKLLYNKYSRI